MDLKKRFALITGVADLNPMKEQTFINPTSLEILNKAINENIDTIKTENLYSFDGKAAYSLGQGQ